MYSEKKIEGVWLFEPRLFTDERGTFHEVFRYSAIAKLLGSNFDVQQVNQSTSKKGVVRGIHVTEGSAGQAKYVSCVNGAILDIVVDLRVGTPSFGTWDYEILSAQNKKVMVIPIGVGHAFVALEDGSTVNYLCSSEFNPELDKTYNIFDPTFGIDLTRIQAEYSIDKFLLSEKDSNAPFLVN